jgi:hypothetical protein
MGLFSKKKSSEHIQQTVSDPKLTAIAECQKLFDEISSKRRTIETSDNHVSKLIACEHIKLICNSINNHISENDLDLPLTTGIINSVDETIEELFQEIENGQSLFKYVHTKVVGSTYNNDDGSSRQEIIAKLKEGDSLDLEATTYKNEPCIEVHHYSGMLGHINKEFVADLYDAVLANKIWHVAVRNITGSKDTNLGCNLILLFC